MARIQCSQCGEVFDPERETATAGQDTTRCPSCRTAHEPAEADTVPAMDEDADADATVSGAGLVSNDLVIEIRIRLEPQEGR
jgi:rubredoxin